MDLAGDVALEAADDLLLGLALAGAALDVGAGLRAVAQTADRDHVQGSVGLAIAPVVEAVAATLPRGDRDRAGAAKRGKRGLAAQPLDVLAGGEQELSGVPGGDPEQGGGPGGGARDQGRELPVELGDLLSRRAIRLARLRSASLAALTGSCRATVVWAQPPAKAGLALQRLGARELLAELAGRGEDQIAELQDRG